MVFCYIFVRMLITNHWQWSEFIFVPSIINFRKKNETGFNFYVVTKRYIIGANMHDSNINKSLQKCLIVLCTTLK